MIKVIGAWERGWNTPLLEADLWVFPLRDYAVDSWCMTPITGIDNNAVHECADMGAEIISARQAGMTIVYIDEAGVTPMSSFVHPENACYVLGKTSLSPLIAYGQEGDLSVRIETPENLGLLWSHQALLLVLHDRVTKQA